MLLAALIVLQAVTTAPPASDDQSHTLNFQFSFDDKFFNLYDADRNGQLSFDELSHGLSEESTAAVETNHAAKKKITSAMIKSSADDFAKKMIHQFDRNGEGFLSLDELRSANSQMRRT